MSVQTCTFPGYFPRSVFHRAELQSCRFNAAVSETRIIEILRAGCSNCFRSARRGRISRNVGTADPDARMKRIVEHNNKSAWIDIMRESLPRILSKEVDLIILSVEFVLDSLAVNKLSLSHAPLSVATI